ncbi:MAG: glycosyltransferase family 39 protein [Thermoleophilaceae bacterium]
MGGGLLGTASGVLMLCVPAVLVPAVLRIRGATAFAVAGLVVAAAEVVAISTAISWGAHYRLGWMLAAEALAAAAAAAAWLASGRPRLPRPPPLTGRWVRDHPLVAALALAAAVALVIQLFQALAVVSNGWDPNAYHLSRAAYWLEYARVGHFPGGTARQLGNPPDGEMLQAWTMMIAGGDGIVNLVQWVALCGVGLGVYLGARLLQFARPASLFAALLTVTMPILIVQATTANNDLIAGFFVVAAAVLGVRALRDRHAGEAVVAACALALAVGAKGIVIVAGPSLLVLWVATAVSSRTPLSVVRLYAASVVVALAALAAPNLVQNLEQTGALYGHANDGTGRTSPVLHNSIWINWSYLDAPGMTVDWLDRAAVELGTRLPGGHSAPSGYSYAFHHSVNDSRGGFGPILLVFLLPLVLFELGRGRSSRLRRAFAGSAALYLLLFPVVVQYDPDATRLALPGVVLGAPLLAALAFRRWTALPATVLAVVVLVFSVLQNPLKPLLDPGVTPAFELTRHQQLAINRGEMARVLDVVEARIGPTAPLAFVGSRDAFDYPFFGPHLERRVIRLDHAYELTQERMRRLGVRAAVLCNVAPPPWLRAITLSPGWTLVMAGRRPA